MRFKRKLEYTKKDNVITPKTFKYEPLDTGVLKAWSIVLFAILFLLIAPVILLRWG